MAFYVPGQTPCALPPKWLWCDFSPLKQFVIFFQPFSHEAGILPVPFSQLGRVTAPLLSHSLRQLVTFLQWTSDYCLVLPFECLAIVGEIIVLLLPTLKFQRQECSIVSIPSFERADIPESL